ncbi:aldehyde dehydrogenase family protein [Nocardia jiangxiensis]|uniref:Aldehyde dehydrogenase family protein n=1 Tax=Nocardia jiangxiensis TaxID=282685 RepID=A0ABW6SCC3_9NOCA|nr:aldehyde dehydrogenase family protein [Nocardia jiangxiensis]
MTSTRELLIGGKSTPAAKGRTTADLNPVTGEVFATVAAAEVQDVVAAVDAAQDRFQEWAELSPYARREIFLAAADVMIRRSDEAVALIGQETGALSMSARFNTHRAADIFRELAASMTAPRGEMLTSVEPDTMSLAAQVPMGVVAGLAPWNAPLILGVRAAAAPLAAGNTVVLKPSEEAPLMSGLFIADVLREAGLPDGVLNVVTNDPADAPAIVETLIADPRVRAVNFTGSSKVGSVIGSLAGKYLKPAVLELGGKNSIIVLDDADIDYAVAATAFAAFSNAGQVCMSCDRILVHAARSAEFTEKFLAKVATLHTGNPDDPAARVGPMINTAAAQRVSGLVADAVAAGATVLAGGGEPEGAIHPPTVFTALPRTASLYYGETFGPVCAIDTFTTDDEAVTKANDTEYGLTAGVITENATHGLLIAQRLQTGIVHINDQTLGDEPQVPFGGFKDSGVGRFGGRWSTEAFSNTRWITIATRQVSGKFRI